MILMMTVMFFPLLGLALFYWLPIRAALPIYVAGLAASVALHRAMMKAMKLPVRTGKEGMIGQMARVLRWENDTGQVRCCGEVWRAVARNGHRLQVDDRIRIVAVDGLTLLVEPSRDERRKQNGGDGQGLADDYGSGG